MYNICPYWWYCCEYLSYRGMQERQCMSKSEMYEIATQSYPPETYYIFFNPPLNKSLDGIYHIVGVAGGPEDFIFEATNVKGQKLHLYSSKVCSIQLRGPKKPPMIPPIPDVPDEITPEVGEE